MHAGNLSCSTRYAGHYAVILHLDAEWSRKLGTPVSQACAELQRRVRQLCSEYRKMIDEQRQSMALPNSQELGKYLFKPLFFIPWGHSDLQVLILLDNFDAIHYVTSGIGSIIEDFVIAFCPILENEDEQSSSTLLRQLDSWFHFSDELATNSPIQSQLPLLAFTRFKCDAFASMGFGLLYQEAVTRAFVEHGDKILAAMQEMRSTSNGLRFIAEDPLDLSNVELAILDMQGAEELGTLIMCRNYSVATTIISSFRTLTYGDLFRCGIAGARLKEAMADSSLLKHLVRLGSQGDGNLEDNHIFRWTNTTLSIEPEAFFNKRSTNCHGFVAATTGFRIAPGHHREFIQRIDAVAKPQPTLFEQPDLTFVDVGTNDYWLAWDNPNQFQHCITLQQAIETTVQATAQFTRPEFAARGRDVIDRRTTLSIPVPRKLSASIYPGRELGEHHFAPFGQTLRKIQQRLFYPGQLEGLNGVSFGRRASILCIEKLRNNLRTYGIPVSLQRNIESLYENFAILFADYYTFDSMLDLYDAFATLHVTLTDHLRKLRLNQELKGFKGAVVPPLDDMRVESLSRFVDALHNAITHRLAKAFPDPVTRELAVDLRGGLNQLLACADVPLKCGLGLLRKYVYGVDGGSRKERVGGLTAVSFRPGIRAFSLPLGTESSSQLCFVEADVPHILHVECYSDYLHEAAHLIFQAKIRTDSGSAIAELDTLANENYENGTNGIDEQIGMAIIKLERLDEIFALLLTRMLIYPYVDGNDFILSQLILNGTSNSRSECTDAEQNVQLSEYLIRVCIANELVPLTSDRFAWLNHEFHDRLSCPISRRNAIEKVITAAGTALPESDRFWASHFSDGWSHCVEEFEGVYTQLVPHLGNLWKWAREIFRRYYPEACQGLASNTSRDPAPQLWDDVNEMLCAGRPLCRLSSVTGTEGDVDQRSIDMLLLVCALLHSDPTRAAMDVQKRMFLPRELDTGKPTFPAGNRGWNHFLIDSGGASVFCCEPEARRSRLVHQIATLKTLWDMASQLRARRLCEIIEDNFAF